ncbi:MAG: hypothetical protein F4Y27_01730 [Acidimicrobiaceae bacterium]|nr:hypothetical protein [Acidimicrobiaceae bacterium]
MKYFCSEPPQYGLNVPSSEYTDQNSAGWRLLRTTDINEDGSLTSGNEVYLKPEAVLPEYRLTAGDLLLSRSGTIGRSFLCTTSKPPSTFAGYLIRFRPRSNIDPRYLNYCVRATFFQDEISANAVVSTISNFNAERYGNLQLPWRPIAEQRAIADYLDTETTRIDTLISKNRHLITLLAEYRTALITETVTRDLPPDATGTAKFGPQGWRPLKYYCSEPPQYGLNVSSSEYTDHNSDDLRLLRTTDIKEDGSLTSGNEVYLNPETISPTYRLTTGDLLLSRSGTLGRSFLFTAAQHPATFAGYLIRFRPRSGVDPRYLNYCFLTTFFDDTITANAVASTIANFNAERYGNLRLPWRPLPEQRAIADDLDTETARIDALSDRIITAINLLQESRSALITAAVTGQIDVPTRGMSAEEQFCT